MGDMTAQGFFSVLRWRLDPTRDEARNVAVLLVDREGSIGGVKAAPLSQISPRLHDQGLLDAVIAGIERQFAEAHKPTLGALTEWQATLQHSLYLTEPKPTAVPDVDVALQALYRAYVQPRGGGSRTLTKGRVLDQVVSGIRRRGFEVRRGSYVNDFLFDAVVDHGGRTSALEVLSFATEARQWTAAEHDAGHFLYAIEQAGLSGVAVVQPPVALSARSASEAFERVTRWFGKADLPVVAPAGVQDHLAGIQTFELGV